MLESALFFVLQALLLLQLNNHLLLLLHWHYAQRQTGRGRPQVYILPWPNSFEGTSVLKSARHISCNKTQTCFSEARLFESGLMSSSCSRSTALLLRQRFQQVLQLQGHPANYKRCCRASAMQRYSASFQRLMRMKCAEILFLVSIGMAGCLIHNGLIGH